VSVTDRAFEVAAATFPRAGRDRRARPFGLDQHEPYLWRVSGDVWDALCIELRHPNLGVARDGDRLLGDPIEVDPSLPPNSMLLEPLPAPIDDH